MSKKPFNLTPHMGPYQFYWGRLGQRLNTNYNVELPGNGSLILSMAFGEVKIEITLALASNETCWVVKDFRVTPKDAHGVLSGYDFLFHYGKRAAQYNQDFYQPDDGVWKITCARDLQALVTAYDGLARELGLAILFGH